MKRDSVNNDIDDLEFLKRGLPIVVIGAGWLILALPVINFLVDEFKDKITTFDKVAFFTIAGASILVAAISFIRSIRLAEVGTALRYRVIILLTSLCGSLYLLLIGGMYVAIRYDFRGERPTWIILSVVLSIAFITAFLIWNWAWDAGRADWERQHKH